ncbi:MULTISPECIES: GNAT family N-acetyltransferase [unclassified Tenacibaculum]|uniref:GNAT family N-acetyltransferase n=1 Tax=unclassified Tenacibaculum TaxID=2635139 RepID=UPI001F228267|nr:MULTISPECIES: GNAT family N-acetyltransferase [unclassified Tenacibaculum]MCF2876146.1 GNAT family N-acetyltransferase [Tenacibaculum sp. Cn5-1]MCF2936221.1 GNAT family N-acetyltransferase [Tenacibaculum sp. Cn5-34]MCG7511564.1 GNAT family N-acetyltransferase [Tenacibaculum sp. Cn5-46]
MIEIKEINTKKEMKQFVKFPFSLYKNNKYWVPPIINDELNSFDKDKNPVFEHANARFFIALKNDEIVGRVAAIINTYEVEKQNIKKMRFGWFDVIDDINVTKSLIEKVKEIGYQNNLEYVEGPVGFNNLDKTGVLVEGFDHIGTMITWYNHPYYSKHLEQLGFKKEKEYLENKFRFSNVNAAKYKKASNIIRKRYNLKALNFTSTKDIMPYVDEMFDLFSKTYSKLSTYVPISNAQIKHFKEKYISFINPEYIKFVLDENNKLVAFAIVMPSFSKALQKANGKLFPFGIFHLLNARRNSKDVIFYLIGVHPEYQNKGVTAIIFEHYAETFAKKNIENCIRTPELEDNIAIQQIWKTFNPSVHKRRRTYKLDL